MTQNLLKELFDTQKAYLNQFFEGLPLDGLEKVLQAFVECKGMIVITGVGKSGLVAEKIAVTMTSTGTRAIFLSPTNALHGDIGIVKAGDVFVGLSKSGESDEVLNLVPYMRNKGVKMVGIVSAPQSRLAKAVDISLTLPPAKELCPFDLAPTTSTTMQMMIGDVLSIALMRLKKISMEEYAQSHPAGKIGKRISLKVKDIMLTQKQIPLCSPDSKIVDTLVELSNKQCGAVLVVDEMKKLLGIFTDGDLRRTLQKKGTNALETSISSIMTKTPCMVGPDKPVWEAMKIMEGDQKHPVMVLPVVEKCGTVVGIIKMHDIVQSGVGL